jgi:hypothetical protein
LEPPSVIGTGKTPSHNGSVRIQHTEIPETQKPQPQVLQPAPSSTSLRSTEENYFEFDWITVGLGILATFFVTGLIPFWLYIWLSLTQTQP